MCGDNKPNSNDRLEQWRSTYALPAEQKTKLQLAAGCWAKNPAMVNHTTDQRLLLLNS